MPDEFLQVISLFGACLANDHKKLVGVLTADQACPMLVVKGKVPSFVELVGVAVRGVEKL